MNMREKTIAKRAAIFCWMCSSLLASVVVIEFQTTEAYSSFDLIKVQYNIYRDPREEKGKVIVRIIIIIIITAILGTSHIIRKVLQAET
jgi:hypothetical protein